MGIYIKDVNGKIEYHISSEDDFISGGVPYEHDNGRYYMLEESRSLRPEMDGALVRRRISKSVYQKMYARAVEAIKTAKSLQTEMR